MRIKLGPEMVRLSSRGNVVTIGPPVELFTMNTAGEIRIRGKLVATDPEVVNHLCAAMGMPPLAEVPGDVTGKEPNE